ncbi:MAG: CDGSH iron-sulfur domain-containing protein [Thaumarchaeota archaeon]|nr:CDGSH iron-sulfur domain-containing protein [Nitrososphaerota archaeon]MDE1842720.1 CDGSH iron-sulfur domain-containing protein [Nitrososphaerota archaeon]
MVKSEKKITITKNGPYLVSGDLPLSVEIIVNNKEGFSWDWKKGKTFEIKSDYALCRCGHSKNVPFCDGTHAKINFNGKEAASKEPYDAQAQKMNGPTLVLGDQENLCAFARFCDPGGKIWSLIEDTDDPKIRELVIREAMHCPSGRLTLHDKKTGKEIEDKLEPSIGIIEDPTMKCSGPIWVRGDVTIESEDGTIYEKRNRVTLCRCGASGNKPFCDGSHASIKFNDGILET